MHYTLENRAVHLLSRLAMGRVVVHPRNRTGLDFDSDHVCLKLQAGLRLGA